MTQDLQEWLSRHRFYPEVIERFVEQMEITPVVILTTKQERFVSALLDGQRIRFPSERIFGLDTGKTKEDVLEQLLECSEFPDATWHFVEDRLATLIRVAGRERLQQVHLYLADWGYNTARDREEARKCPRITLWNSERFLMV
jgi:hypothetical protein